MVKEGEALGTRGKRRRGGYEERGIEERKGKGNTNDKDRSQNGSVHV